MTVEQFNKVYQKAILKRITSITRAIETRKYGGSFVSFKQTVMVPAEICRYQVLHSVYTANLKTPLTSTIVLPAGMELCDIQLIITKSI